LAPSARWEVNVEVAVPAPADEPRASLVGLRRPPGILMIAATAVVVVLWIEASSRYSLMGMTFSLPVVGLIGLIWLIRFVAAGVKTRGRLSTRSWARWLLVPAVLVGAGVLTGFDVPFQARLALSRPAMDQAAVEIMAGGTTDRDWIGLWPVQLVEPIDGGVMFLIEGSGFMDRVGLAYSVSGTPADPYDDVEYTDLGGGWWQWWSEF
jgi:hypothetical protein